jgi:hypothetical protein
MSAVKYVEKAFLDNRVQKLLKKLTGYDLDKIFKTKYMARMQDSRMELLSDLELDEVLNNLPPLFYSLSILIKKVLRMNSLKGK